MSEVHEQQQKLSPLLQSSRPLKPEYENRLYEFMSFKDSKVYTKANHPAPFTTQELSEIKPIDISRWFSLKIYRTPDPLPSDRPTQGRSSSIAFYKKALSYYMPDQQTAWNDTIQKGNPTRSTEVNDFIRTLKKFEDTLDAVDSSPPKKRRKKSTTATALNPSTTTATTDTNAAQGSSSATPGVMNFNTLFAQNAVLHSDVKELRAEVKLLSAIVNKCLSRLEEGKNGQQTPKKISATKIGTLANATTTAHRMPIAANSNLKTTGILNPLAARSPYAANYSLNNIDGNATLTANPRSLEILWQEYEDGIDGRKPSKFFNAKERGKCKYLYTRRKVFWDQMVEMISKGYTPDKAIAKIREVYGVETSVTKIINAMRTDRNVNGGKIPALTG